MQSNVILRAENVGKIYRLGLVGTGTISHDLNRWWSKVRGKEDPYLKVVETNVRSTKGKSDYIWALNDISFEVDKGEVLGIIGKNGAGKSTLLKILSRVTLPTQGVIKTKGRIASLLEVGTGFHPEMTGRENVYLNGAILGMTRAEIKERIDEIIDFSGCERFIDTPVKRYSSGMKVRLAFAVAAHLEPDILVVDEVLAVGDAEFQKKAIGKMQDISQGEGRTVLFVSHDMNAIEKLTNRTIVLINGKVAYNGKTSEAINFYLKNFENRAPFINWTDINSAPGNDYVRLKSVYLKDEDGNLRNRFNITENLFLTIEYYDSNKKFNNTAIFHILNERKQTLFASNEFVAKDWIQKHKQSDLIFASTCKIPGNLLAEGSFSILVAVGNYNPEMIHLIEKDLLTFEIYDSTQGEGVRGPYIGKWPGLMRPMLDWTIEITDKKFTDE
ncbi:ABC transporter ATP-binding protein [Winogradskyella vincentii]|uniref:ABC transporter ATP-binding protein n=1 Tax=Winogradskyella vincentii TaxID=2877122 RepID=A0ABS7Y1B3_9FLAO|nr:ABC transporter ATP-binding protein [Winogradskyella vincentii]MCA0153723.1 ABC transporter ATP-binding protein [Winogradskyella vincentii]